MGYSPGAGGCSIGASIVLTPDIPEIFRKLPYGSPNVPFSVGFGKVIGEV